MVIFCHHDDVVDVFCHHEDDRMTYVRVPLDDHRREKPAHDKNRSVQPEHIRCPQHQSLRRRHHHRHHHCYCYCKTLKDKKVGVHQDKEYAGYIDNNHNCGR